MFEFLEKIKQEKLNKKYMVGRKYTVSGERHVDLLLSYNSQKESLAKLEDNLFKRQEEIIKREDENRKIKTQLTAIEKEYGMLMDKINESENRINVMEYDDFKKIFVGIWVCFWRIYGSSEDWNREEFEVSENNKYNKINKDKSFTKQYELLLLSIGHNGGIRFMKRGLVDNVNQFKKVSLKVNVDGGYSGTEEEYVGTGTVVKRFEVRYLNSRQSINSGLNNVVE